MFVSSQVYKSKTEAAKKEYLKALAAYRASLVSKVRNYFFFSPEKCANLTENWKMLLRFLCGKKFRLELL